MIHGSVQTEALKKDAEFAVERLKFYMQRSAWPWLFWVLFDWTLIALAIIGAGAWHHPLGYILAAAVIGNRQHAIEILGHDGAHYAICTNRRLNDFLTSLFAFSPMWISLRGYRKFHFAHHHFVGTENDPELAIKASEGKQWAMPASVWRILRYNLYDLMGYGFIALARLAIQIKPVSFRDFLGPLVVNLAATTALVASGNAWVLLLWYGAMGTFHWAFFRWRVWFEHQGSETTHRCSLPRWLAALVSPHHMDHHWEHHRWLGVPFHKLPALRREVTDGPIVKTLEEMLRLFRHAPALTSHPVMPH